MLSLVPKSVLFGALPRPKNRALDRAFWSFWCSPLCSRSSFLMVFPVPQKNAFWCSLSLIQHLCSPLMTTNKAFSQRCTEPATVCMVLARFALHILLLEGTADIRIFAAGHLERGERGNWTQQKKRLSTWKPKENTHVTSKSCSRSCFLALSFVQKIVLFGALLRAKSDGFWCSPSCQKSYFLVLSPVPKIVL